jgi:hypothetical protein
MPAKYRRWRLGRWAAASVVLVLAVSCGRDAAVQNSSTAATTGTVDGVAEGTLPVAVSMSGEGRLRIWLTECPDVGVSDLSVTYGDLQDVDRYLEQGAFWYISAGPLPSAEEIEGATGPLPPGEAKPLPWVEVGIVPSGFIEITPLTQPLPEEKVLGFSAGFWDVSKNRSLGGGAVFRLGDVPAEAEGAVLYKGERMNADEFAALAARACPS